jgi:hypothetical protein
LKAININVKMKNVLLKDIILIPNGSTSNFSMLPSFLPIESNILYTVNIKTKDQLNALEKPLKNLRIYFVATPGKTIKVTMYT